MNNIEKTTISDDDMVTVTKMGTIAEVKKGNITPNHKPIIKKIDKHHYIDLETGELKEFKERRNSKGSNSDCNRRSRKDNPKSLSTTGRNHKEIIISNFKDTDHTMYITLLFDEVITDFNEAYDYMKNFIKSVRRNFCKNNYVKYVNLTEKHYNGSIHFHALLYWDKPYPKEFANNLKKHWKKGDSLHKPIRCNQDILFLAAYFVNGFTADKGNFEKNDIATNNDEKWAIKNARLEDYPAYSRVIKHSIGMEKGIKFEMPHGEAIEKYGYNGCFSKGEIEKKLDDVYIRQCYEYYML